MYRFLLILVFLPLSFLFISAQEVLPPGLLWDDADYDSLPSYDIADTTRSSLYPKKSLMAYCPRVGDQCNQNSCVAWSISYAMTIRLAIKCNRSDQTWINDHFFSPAFIYNQVRAAPPCDSGAFLIKTIKFVSAQGVCFERSFPYDCQNCKKMPGDRQRLEAVGYKITDAMRVFRSSDSDKNKIDSTLNALSNDNPVIVAMKDVANPANGHALVVVAYDKPAKTFTLLNSYSKRWGDSGYFKLSFEEFANRARYGVVIEMGKECK